MEVGGWVQNSLRKNIILGKSYQNYRILVLIIWGSVPCAFSVSTLLKVASHYDLSVLSMSEMSFQKKVLIWGWLGEASSIQFFLWEFWWNFFNFEKPLTVYL